MRVRHGIAALVITASLVAQDERLLAELKVNATICDRAARISRIKYFPMLPTDLALVRETIAALEVPPPDPGTRTRDADVMFRVQIRCVHVHVPETAKDPAPLILYLHGAGGDGREGIERWRSVAAELGAVIVAPQAEEQNEGHTYSMLARDTVMRVLDWVRGQMAIDPDRVFLVGVSRGAHLAWDVALRRPDRWAALVPMIGGPRLLPQDGQHNLRLLENLVPVPIRDLQGQKDDPRLLANLEFAFDRLQRLGAKHAQLVKFADHGHGFDFGTVEQWVEYLRPLRREPVPKQVVFCTANSEEMRAFWVECLQLERSVQEEFKPRLPANFNDMDAVTQVRLVTRDGEQKMARIAAKMTGRGAFTVDSRGVTKFRLLLDETMFEEGKPVTVRWNGKSRKLDVKPSTQVLLADWAERMDRGFLPVAEVVIR